MNNIAAMFRKNIHQYGLYLNNIATLFRKNIRQYGMLLALIVIMLFFEIATGGILLKPINIDRLIQQNSYILVLSIGMMFCILTGGNIDLSVGSIVGLVGACSAVFSVMWGLPVVVSIVLALGVGILVGMWQGYWIAYMKIPAFIVTLAGLLVFRGFTNLILVGGQTIPLPDLYVTIASKTVPDFIGKMLKTTELGIDLTTVVVGFLCSIVFLFLRLSDRKTRIKYNLVVPKINLFILGAIFYMALINVFAIWLAMANGLLYIVILLLVLIIVYSFIANKTVIGRHVYALGGNSKTAELSGIKTKKVMFLVYANMGLLAAVAGIVAAGRFNSAAPTAGDGVELDAIAGCFIGGASATGGIGTIVGAMIGGAIMGILNNGMSIMGIDTFWQKVVKGMVLLLAVAFDVYSKTKSKSK